MRRLVLTLALVASLVALVLVVRRPEESSPPPGTPAASPRAAEPPGRPPPAPRDVRRLTDGRPAFAEQLHAYLATGERPPGWTAMVLANVSPDPGVPLSIALVADALAAASGGDRELAQLLLLQPELYRALARFSDRLRPSLGDFATSERSAELLGLLDLPPTLRAALLAADVPDRVKGRLGDAAAEGRVIASFDDAPPADRAARALDLLYLDTPAAWEAFGRGLASDAWFPHPTVGDVAVVQALIQAYGRVYPDARLFQPRGYERHLYVAGDDFQAARHQQYLRRVERSLAVRHGVVTRIDVPFLVRGDDRPDKFYVRSSSD